MEKIKNNFKYSYIINILFVAIIMIVCLWDVGSLQRIRVVDDGFCYWGIAASLAGYDWTELMAASSYYSYGYSLILVPLFWLYRLGLSMTVIYRLAIVLNAIFMCGIYFMAYYMIRELFEDLPDTLKQIISLTVVLYIGNTVQMDLAWTEIFLCFMFWCNIVCLYRVIRKPGYGNLFGLIFTTAFLFAIHMRAIGVAAAVGIVILCFFIANWKKINKKYIFYTLGISVLFGGLVIIMKNYVSDSIYLGNAADSTNNIQANINRVEGLLSISGIADLMVSVIGKIFYISSATFLLALIGALIAIVSIVCSFIKKDEIGTRKKWQSKEWMTIFLLLAFFAEIGVEAIFKCQAFFRSTGSLGLGDSLVFGRYADFVVGPMLIFGIWAVYHLKTHYKAVLISLLAAICCTGVVQFFYNELAFRNGTDTVSLRGLSSPWLAILADGHKTDFACYVMLVSIAVLLVICLVRLLSTADWYGYGAIFLFMIAVWSVLGVISGIEYTASKMGKEKSVDTVAKIAEIAGEDTQIYLVGTRNTDVKILQWILADRSIHTCSIDDIDGIDMEQAIVLVNSDEVRTMSKLSDEFRFLYDSGSLSVFADTENKLYKTMSEKAEEMAQVSVRRENSISLVDVATDLSYTKMNGSLYYNYRASDGGYMTEKMGITPEDGVYEFTIDMRVRDCVADTEIGYITVGDASGKVQYTQALNANDFIEKDRQNVSVLVKIENWAEPVIGVYTYGEASYRIYDISYQKKVGNIQLDSEEIASIADFLKGQDEKPVYYIDSDNSGTTGFPWWKYGKLNYLPGKMLAYKENFEEAYYIVEKTDEAVVDYCQSSMGELLDMKSYIVFTN